MELTHNHPGHLQNACKTRLEGIKNELKHLQKEAKSNEPELKKAQQAFDSLRSRIAELSATVHDAEDGVFRGFCRQIGVSDIRQYEERQLKVAQEESEARLRFDTQIARLGHQ